MIDVDTAIEQAEALCRKIIPEWRTLQIYIVRADSLPRQLAFGAAGCSFYGFTTPTLHYRLIRDLLPDRWKGPGPTMVVDTESLLSALQPRDDWAITTEIMSTVLHESAHVVADAYDFDLPPAEHHTRERSEWFLGKVAEVLANPNLPEPTVHEVGHDALRFGRVVIHLAYRANRQGHYLTARRIAGRPFSYAYTVFLADEVERCRDWRLRKVLEQPLPPVYVDAWNDELADFELQRVAAFRPPLRSADDAIT